MKFKAIYKRDSNHSETIGIYKDVERAIQELLKKGEGNYCLDDRQEREDSLRMRHFCMCGCGPASMEIEEIEN